MSGHLAWFAMLWLAVSSLKVAAEEPREQIIRHRVAQFREIGTAYKLIGDELNSKRPDVPKLQEAAHLIKDRGAQILHWFPVGSEPLPSDSNSWLGTILGWFSSDEGFVMPDEVKSHAKPAVWSRWDEFKEAHSRFVAQTNVMVQAVQGGQPALIGAEWKKLGSTCKGCHDDFRERLD